MPEKSTLLCANAKLASSNAVMNAFITPPRRENVSGILSRSRRQTKGRPFSGRPMMSSNCGDRLDVQVLHIQRLPFDELAPRFDVFAHQRGEDGLALGNIFELHR